MLNLEEDWTQIDRLEGAVKAYHTASGRTLAFAMIKTGREIAFALLKETAKIAPDPTKIRAGVAKLGFGDPKRSHRVPTGNPGAARARLQIRAAMGSMSRLVESRIKARHFMAAGWKPAVKAFIGHDTVATVIKPLGGCIANVDMNSGNAQIRMLNRANGVETQTRKHEILKRAVNRVMLGFSPYIKRKLGEEAQKAFLHI